MEDSQIIALLWSRNEEGLRAIKEKYGRLAAHLAENIIGSREDGEECVSDALLVLWEKIPPESPDPLIAYLLRVVRNLAIKRKRRNTAQKRDPGSVVCLDELAGTLCKNESDIDTSLLRDALDTFLRSLAKEERRLFVRRYWYCEDISALANEFSQSESAIKVRLYRTRNKLKAYLIKEELLT